MGPENNMFGKDVISRRSFLRAVTFAAGAVLSGCGADTEQPATGKIRLTQWYHQYEAGAHAAVLRYAREYTELNPNIEIKVVWVPGNYPTKLSTGLIANMGPDIFEANLSNILSAVSAGHVLPLDDILTEADRQDFDPSSLALNTVGGKLYGIPEVVDVCLLYYRPSLFKAAGVQPPTNADELIAVAKALTSPRTKGLFVGNDGGMTSLQGVVPWSAGADFIVDGKIAFDTAQTAAAFEKIKELYDSGSLLIGAPTDWWVPDAFTENLAAMQWTGLWAMNEITEALGDDVGILPWPPLTQSPECAPVTPLTVWAECINANSPHLEEAKHFVRWLWIENKKSQEDFCTSYGLHIPPRQSVAANTQLFAGGIAGTAVEIARRDRRAFSSTWTSAMQTFLVHALSRIIRENSPAAEEIHRAAQRCAAELADRSAA
jgi:multiple sugar transport system substrate-binding protein